MKHASLLIAFCVLLSPLFSQSTTTVEKNASRITITTKKVDENGKTITETYIAEGTEPAKILEQMAINPETINKVDLATESSNGERLFLFRSAGNDVQVEGILDENIEVTVEEPSDNERRVVVIRSNSDGTTKTSTYETPGTRMFVTGFGHNSEGRKSNCAALGVYVTADEAAGGARINSLIESGGAQDAGLLSGDVVTKIDKYDVVDFKTLHEALSHFRDGDVVTVRYIREDKPLKAKVELRDWSRLPGHEWRSRPDCGQPESLSEVDTDDNLDRPDNPSTVNQLQLEDIRMYPNPTDGNFSLSFRLEPGPLSVSVTDINGKVVYNEENQNTTGHYNRDINLKDVPTGNYILSVKQGDRIFTEQISKQ